VALATFEVKTPGAWGRYEPQPDFWESLGNQRRDTQWIGRYGPDSLTYLTSQNLILENLADNFQAIRKPCAQVRILRGAPQNILFAGQMLVTS
jgi:hypothetical protein